MTVVISDPSIIMGVTHLLVDGELRRLLKCPFCSFQNIHENTIIYHIKFTDDAKHNRVDEQLAKGQYVVISVSPYGPYLSKAERNTPWIRCLYCNYRDKIEFDLSLHMIEKHREKLLHLKISYQDQAKLRQSDPFARFYGRIEYRLDKAIEMANRRGQVDRAIDAVNTKS